MINYKQALKQINKAKQQKRLQDHKL